MLIEHQMKLWMIPMKKNKRVYLICDYNHKYSRFCGGRVLNEDGSLIARHNSSSISFLRSDLMAYLGNQEGYEIIDLIEKKIPDKFKLKENLIVRILKKFWI